MQLRDRDEEAKTQMPEVQRHRENNSVRELRRSRMGHKEQQGMPQMPVNRMPVRPYPSPYRFYTGSIGLGMAVGITWTLAMTNNVAQHYITKAHAVAALYGISFLLFAAQGWMLRRWRKRLERDRAELVKMAVVLMEKAKQP
jgi:hypothetical protein